MRVISLKGLGSCWERHPASEQPLRAWSHEVEAEEWATPHDLRRRYGTASILGGGRVVFSVGANRYRVVAHVRYDLGRVYVRFVGTHAEYDRIDAETI